MSSFSGKGKIEIVLPNTFDGTLCLQSEEDIRTGAPVEKLKEALSSLFQHIFFLNELELASKLLLLSLEASRLWKHYSGLSKKLEERIRGQAEAAMLGTVSPHEVRRLQFSRS